MWGAIKSICHSHMECGGTRSATPLWLEAPLEIRHKHKLKRCRASLSAALHMAACAVSAIHPCHSGAKRICSAAQFRPNEAGAPDTSFSDELLLGRRVLIIQGNCAADRWDRDAAF